NNVNVETLEQHSEDGVFFTRISWIDNDQWESKEDFKKGFQPIIDKFEGEEVVHFFKKTQKLGLFVSREPHALLEILNKIETGEFGKIEVPFIISGLPDAEKIAKRYDIPFYHTPTKKGSLAHETPQLEIIKKHKPDFIGLARYMKILSEDFINNTGCPIINIHHSFLPSFIGSRPYEMAYERGVKLIGATSHYVTPVLDDGPIIEQGVIRIRSGYSVDYIKKVGRGIEKETFAKALTKVLEHKVILHKNRTVVFE
ncbi:MAG: formyltetrahydrofolate deformylase, partial [Candidatus Peregrinibacteria bacterium]|nr:formyltetrahydrofolate deformylase [Candidatus Peregrinibacteria bacterium]